MNGYVDNLVYDDTDTLASASAHYIATVLEDAIRDREAASICMAGGGTPRATYQSLASTYGASVDWSRVEVWFGDERCLPPDHEDSNFRMVDDTLLSQVAIPLANIHRIPGELHPLAAARAHDLELHAAFPDVKGDPTFDLLLLGVGADGHVVSLFPHSPALDERGQWAVAVDAPNGNPPVPRVTLTPPILERARRVLYLVAGAAKRDITRRVLLGGEDLPAARFAGREHTLWLMDLEASPAR